MAHKTVLLELPSGKKFNLRFGAIGAFLLQKETGLSIIEFAERVDNMDVGFMELHALLYAELETSRRKDRAHPIPWTLDSVGDLIDDECEGDIGEFWTRYGSAVLTAFHQTFHLTSAKNEELKRRQDEARKAAAEAGPTTAASTSTGDSPANGTTSSTTPPTSE